jgi:uptake hydrogenase large subunit
MLPTSRSFPAGVLVSGGPRAFDEAQVREHSRFSWFADEGPRHPTQVVVTPDRSTPDSYSWATAPRYGQHDHVMQLGPLAELVLAEDPLTTDLVTAYGVSAYRANSSAGHAAPPISP